jgi:hypothetical protein
MTVYTTFIGIDIGKYEIVVGFHKNKSTASFPNDKKGFDAFFKAYKPLLKSSFVVLETTGGYEKLFLDNLFFLIENVFIKHSDLFQFIFFFIEFDLVLLFNFFYCRILNIKLYIPFLCFFQLFFYKFEIFDNTLLLLFRFSKT